MRSLLEATQAVESGLVTSSKRTDDYIMVRISDAVEKVPGVKLLHIEIDQGNWKGEDAYEVKMMVAEK